MPMQLPLKQSPMLEGRFGVDECDFVAACVPDSLNKNSCECVCN